jgi:hypothetical protein
MYAISTYSFATLTDALFAVEAGNVSRDILDVIYIEDHENPNGPIQFKIDHSPCED